MFLSLPGVYFFHFDDLLKNKANIGGKRWKNGGKGEVFTVPGGKISFLNKGLGQSYPILGKYTPLVSLPSLTQVLWCICLVKVTVYIMIRGGGGRYHPPPSPSDLGVALFSYIIAKLAKFEIIKFTKTRFFECVQFPGPPPPGKILYPPLIVHAQVLKPSFLSFHKTMSF